MNSSTQPHPEEREAVAVPENTLTHTGLGGCLSLDKIPAVRGVNFNGYARAAISMSNIYMNNMLIYFSCKAGGGFGEGEKANTCVDPDVTVYGMKPAALISNILIVAAVLSAVMMPVFGAVVDYTRHRRMVGIVMSVLLTIITAVQIGTTEVSVVLSRVVLCCVVLHFNHLFR
jgi:MFS-type transporter involved in bile tolerance (Atg22 family)